jgi:hypothetical protein
MPGYNRAELAVELSVSPVEHADALRRAAGETGLAHDAGPDATGLSGSRADVLDALRRVVEAALDAGARVVEARVEAQEAAERFP